MDNMIEIDGSLGEGGGQILRTTLTLSVLYGKPVRISKIRAGRPKPGLMRQHLVCVHAAQKVCNAQVKGDYLKSDCVEFIPGSIQGGEYHFEIGSAGSTTLVFQTVILPLLVADEESVVYFSGGTHNPMAPSLTDIKHGFLPLLRLMGADIETTTERWGFAPAGGGRWSVRIKPSVLNPVHLTERPQMTDSNVKSYLSGIKKHVGVRELEAYKDACHTDIETLKLRFPESISGGNLLSHRMHFGSFSTCFSKLGKQGVSAEKIARQLSAEVNHYIACGAVLNQYLADQMMLPMLVAGGGAFTASEITLHSETNVDTVFRLTGKKIDISEYEGVYKLSL